MTEKDSINKMNKLIQDLMIEYRLEIDDIRWFISYQQTISILSFSETPLEITTKIWSGKLEAELYNLEEKYLENISSQLERGLIDEAWIREQFAEASELRSKRS